MDAAFVIGFGSMGNACQLVLGNSLLHVWHSFGQHLWDVQLGNSLLHASDRCDAFLDVRLLLGNSLLHRVFGRSSVVAFCLLVFLCYIYLWRKIWLYGKDLLTRSLC
jgi:hypothetical protein